LNMRTKGMSMTRLPLTIWAIFFTAILGVLSFPVLLSGAILLLFDRNLGTSFYLSDIVVKGEILPNEGGSAILFQHLFWFLGHPEVYVLILPAIGIVAEVISNNIRKPLWGYKSMVYAAMSIGFLSFIVWAHHMYLTGMGTKVATFFQTTTMMISIPSVIILTALFISLWGGSIRFNSASLFALSFLPMFGIGGLTGLPLGFNASDIFLHDSYYVIGHFHYVVAPGTMFAVFAGIYYWFPKITGRHMNELLGKIHWAGSLFFMNCVFAPMFIQGFKGMSRRMSDGGTTYFGPDAGIGADPGVLGLNKMIFMCAIGLGIAQIPFIINFFSSIFAGKRTTSDNPWQATTLEWATPTPPPHGNFLQEPVAYRGPYEYSVPGAKTDFTPQGDKN